MTYFSTTSIVGKGVANADAIDRWFAKRGPEYKGYAPDNAYKPAPAIGAFIVGFSDMAGINSDLVAAQCLHESAAWQSAIARDKNNPAGIGAENDDSTGTAYDKAITFLTPDLGIRAQVAHLCDYAVGKGDWTQYDPRASAMPKAWFGIAKSLNGLDGRWAFPGIGYGASVAALANDLVAFAQQTGGTMAGDDPRFDWTPDTTEFGYGQGTHGRNGQPVDLLILHITAGTDSQSWLLGGHGSSTHYLTRQDGSPRAQHVAEADAAWTPGSRAYALRSINVEVEMLHTTDWTDAIMREVARTIAPIMQRHGIPAVYLGRDNGPGKRGMIGHRDVPNPLPTSDANYCGPWGGSSCHTDPSPTFDWPKFVGLVKAELAGGVVIPPDPNAARWFPETGHSLGGGFKAFWDANGGLPIFGFPLTEERTEDGLTVQYFERAIFEYHPGNSAPNDIQLRRLGAEALERQAA